MPNPSDKDRIMVAVAYQAVSRHFDYYSTREVELTRLRSQEWFTEDRRFKAPESARTLLTSNPNIIPLCDFYPDVEWDTFCQVGSINANSS